jgi:hypothetical protein
LDALNPSEHILSFALPIAPSTPGSRAWCSSPATWHRIGAGAASPAIARCRARRSSSETRGPRTLIRRERLVENASPTRKTQKSAVGGGSNTGGRQQQLVDPVGELAVQGKLLHRPHKRRSLGAWHRGTINWRRIAQYSLRDQAQPTRKAGHFVQRFSPLRVAPLNKF